MSTNYKKIWEDFRQTKLPPGFEIHHIDGNRSNNDPSNLQAVTIEQHLQIHLLQNDHGTVQAILIRMNRSVDENELLIQSAPKLQKKLLDQNRHNFQKDSCIKNRKTAIKKEHEKRKSLGKGAFWSISDTVENSRYAGKKAAEKCAGFLNTSSENHGSKYVKTQNGGLTYLALALDLLSAQATTGNKE